MHGRPPKLELRKGEKETEERREREMRKRENIPERQKDQKKIQGEFFSGVWCIECFYCRPFSSTRFPIRFANAF
jgi:hypothetical protein